MNSALYKPKRVAILGPHGTFTEEAFLTQSDLAEAETILCPSIADVLASVESDYADLGFVAIENSIEGGINVTLDTLAFEADLLIQREVVVGIQLNLWGTAEAELGKIRQVFSFPQALAQCRLWLQKNLGQAETHASDSTATAIKYVAEGADPTIAAIGTRRAGELHKLKCLAKGIEDHPENVTRFVGIAKKHIPAASGHDKTSVVVFQRNDRPGSLLVILQEFAARSINLTRLESRPTKEALGNYCFLLDFEGHISDDLVADCLMNIRQKHADIKFLGSYPAAGEQAPSNREQHKASQKESQAWLKQLRSQIN